MKTACADHDMSDPRSQHGVAAIVEVRIHSTSTVNRTSPDPIQDDFERRDVLLVVSGLRHYHKNVTPGVRTFS
jgi:hypothetical protein